jgi:hypothetical protein
MPVEEVEVEVELVLDSVSVVSEAVGEEVAQQQELPARLIQVEVEVVLLSII